MLKTIEELRTDGWKALTGTLGLAEATRFLLQYQKGSGDYTKYRHEILKNISVNDIVKDLKRM